MTCICKPWTGFHRQECPCQAAYEEQREAALEEGPQDEAEIQALAAQLVAEGWRQKSRKYREVVRLAVEGSALAELERRDPEKAADLRTYHAKQLECSARTTLWHDGEKRALPLRVFEAFRAAAKASGVW